MPYYNNPNITVQGASGEFDSVANDTSKYDSVTNYFETLNH